ncbi:unnamed protein product, partial [Discosporangium mesarthrocarpum]
NNGAPTSALRTPCLDMGYSGRSGGTVTPQRRTSTTGKLGRTPSSEGDRFIPNRAAMDYDLCRHLIFHGADGENDLRAGADAPAPL